MADIDEIKQKLAQMAKEVIAMKKDLENPFLNRALRIETKQKLIDRSREIRHLQQRLVVMEAGIDLPNG